VLVLDRETHQHVRRCELDWLALASEIDMSLSAILSKLRAAFRAAGLTDAGIDPRLGTLNLRLPAATTVDIEDAANAVDEAEGAVRLRDIWGAWGHAPVVVARRPFLAREETHWIELGTIPSPAD
jgi:hypothetical protein